MDTTPSKGLNTWIGYGLSFLSLLAAALLTGLQATDATDQPVWVQLVLTALGMALAGLTGKTRSDQAQTLTVAAFKREELTARAAAMAPVAPVSPDEYRGQASVSDAGPMTPGDLDAVDQSDAELLPEQEG